MSTLNEIKYLPQLSSFPQFTYEKHEEKVYDGNTYYVLTGKTSGTTLERIVSTVKALALTIISCGIALIFTQVREYWKHALSGIKQVTVRATDEQLPISIRMTIYNSWNKDPKAIYLDRNLTKEKALEMLRKKTLDFEELPLHLRQDISFLIALLEADEKFRFNLLFLSTTDSVFANANENDLLKLIEKAHFLINKIPENLLNSKEFFSKMSEKCRKKISDFIALPSCCSKDKEIIREWMENRLDTFERISADLQQDLSFIAGLKAINPDLDKYLTCKNEKFKNQETVSSLLDLIEKDPSIFNLLPESMKFETSLLLKNPIVYPLLPIHIRQNPDYISKLIEIINKLDETNAEKAVFIPFASTLFGDTSLLLNTVFMEKVIKKAKKLENMPYQLLNNRTFLLEILNIEGLKKDETVLLPNRFADDQEVILKWMSRGITIEDMGRISSTLKKDPEFVKKAKEYCNAIDEDFEYLLKLDKIRNATADEVLPLVTKRPRTMRQIDPNLRNNQDFLIKCLKQNWEIIHEIDTSLLIEQDFVSRVCEETGKSREEVQSPYFNIFTRHHRNRRTENPISVPSFPIPAADIDESSVGNSEEPSSFRRPLNDRMILPPPARATIPPTSDPMYQSLESQTSWTPNPSLWQAPMMPPVGFEAPSDREFTSISAPYQPPMGLPTLPTPPSYNPAVEATMMNFLETTYGRQSNNNRGEIESDRE